MALAIVGSGFAAFGLMVAIGGAITHSYSYYVS